MALETVKRTLLHRLAFAKFDYLAGVDIQGPHNRRKKMEAKPEA